MFLGSQSPQTGQFNSYSNDMFNLNSGKILCLNPLKRVNSILTHNSLDRAFYRKYKSQSPQTGQFNSYTLFQEPGSDAGIGSQSPQTGQFNSYINPLPALRRRFPNSLNPLKRVNSILTCKWFRRWGQALYSSQSPQTGQFNSYYEKACWRENWGIWVSIPSNGSIQFLLKKGEK